jgi:hypothetical protein
MVAIRAEKLQKPNIVGHKMVGKSYMKQIKHKVKLLDTPNLAKVMKMRI